MYIQETFEGNASSTNVITGASRFTNVPRDCRLVMEAEASDGDDSTNFATMELSEPDGEVPLTNSRLPKSATYGGLDTRTKAIYSMNVQQGGHLGVKVTVTGTCRYLLRITIYFRSRNAFNAFRDAS